MKIKYLILILIFLVSCTAKYITIPLSQPPSFYKPNNNINTSKELIKEYQKNEIEMIDGEVNIDIDISNNLNYQEEEALKAIDNEFASREKSFNSWADGVINLSLDKLRELLNQAYQELMNMEIKNPNDQNLAKARAKVNTLRKAIGDKEVEKEISPGKATNDWKEQGLYFYGLILNHPLYPVLLTYDLDLNKPKKDLLPSGVYFKDEYYEF